VFIQCRSSEISSYFNGKNTSLAAEFNTSLAAEFNHFITDWSHCSRYDGMPLMTEQQNWKLISECFAVVPVFRKYAATMYYTIYLLSRYYVCQWLFHHSTTLYNVNTRQKITASYQAA